MASKEENKLEEITGILKTIQELDSTHCNGFTYLRIPNNKYRELIKALKIEKFEHYKNNSEAADGDYL